MEKNMEKKYIVVDETYNGDTETEVFDTPESANREAQYLWNHLPLKEQEKRHIYAAVVTESDLDDDAIDAESGKIDWLLYKQSDAFPGAFDSENA